jgi:ribosomal protein L37AE/L43A
MTETQTSYEPDCPQCGMILPEHWRLKEDRSKWECRFCRRNFGVHEVIP